MQEDLSTVDKKETSNDLESRILWAVNVISINVISAGNYMLKVNNRNTRIKCEICSKLIIETLEQGVKYVQS